MFSQPTQITLGSSPLRDRHTTPSSPLDGLYTPVTPLGRAIRDRQRAASRLATFTSLYRNMLEEARDALPASNRLPAELDRLLAHIEEYEAVDADYRRVLEEVAK